VIPVIRASLFWLGLMVSTVVVGVALLLLAPFPFLVRQRFSTVWPYFNLWWLRVTCGLRHEVEGLEHIPDGAAIYLCKHQSAWETIVMESVLPPMVWVLKRELLRIPVFGWAVALLRPIGIDRSKGREAVEQLVTQGANRLEAGISVVVFPEGTRTAPGKKGKYRVGGALLAERTGFPVVPIAHNAGYFWPRRGFVKKPGVIRMVIGPAIDPKGLTAGEINKKAETWIEEKVAELGGPQ
jgi:1-acyl-sn-glycerol-3-phosphate acyltransferase